MSEIFVPKEETVRVDLDEYVKSVELENKLNKYSTSSQIAAGYFPQATINKLLRNVFEVDGSKQMKSDIDLDTNGIINCRDPVEENDVVNKKYSDTRVNNKSYITIWAEENGSIQRGQFCFGFGANGFLKAGYVNMMSGKIVRGSVVGVKRDKNFVLEETTIDILINGRAGTGVDGDKFKDSYGKIIKPAGVGKVSMELTTPIPITGGDIINFRNSNSVSSVSQSVVALLIELN